MFDKQLLGYWAMLSRLKLLIEKLQTLIFVVDTNMTFPFLAVMFDCIMFMHEEKYLIFMRLFFLEKNHTT